MENMGYEKNSIKKFLNRFNRVSWRQRPSWKVYLSLFICFEIYLCILGFNEAAWAKLDKLEGTEIDRELLKKNLGPVTTCTCITTGYII